MNFINMPAGFKLNQGGSPSPFGDMSNKLQDKSQGLALMLYALGGALRGDKDFVQNTLALQEMQEGKKKQKKREENFQRLLSNMDPNNPLYQYALAIGAEGSEQIAKAQYEAATQKPKERKMLKGAEGYYRYVDTGERVFPGIVKPPKEKTISDYVADIAKKVQEDPNYQLSDQDKRILGISRKSSESAMLLEELQAQALKDINLTNNSNLLTYPSLQAAINAGLKKGDKFKGTDGVTYQIP